MILTEILLLVIVFALVMLLVNMQRGFNEVIRALQAIYERK